MNSVARLACCVLLVALSACTHGPLGAGVIPRPASALTHPAESTQTYVTFTLDSQATTPKGRSVRRVVISYPGNPRPATTINLTATGCTCTVQVKADPNRQQLFWVDTFDGESTRLSHTWIFEQFPSSQIALTLASTVGGAYIATDNPTPAYGKTAHIHVYVNAVNSEGIVVGPGAFSHPITLLNDPILKSMAITPNVLRSAADPVPTLVYRGGFQSAAITSSAGRRAPPLLITPLIPVKAVPLAPGGQIDTNITTRDGYLWVVHDYQRRRVLDRVDASGAVKTFHLPPKNSYPATIVAGASGDGVWYGGCNPVFFSNSPWVGGVGRVNETMSAAAFYANAYDVCGPMTLGPDDNVWFAAQKGIQKIDRSGVITSVPTQAPVRESSAILFMPNGTFWTLHDWSYNGAKLDHYSQNGVLLGESGSGFDELFSGGPGRVIGATEFGRRLEVFNAYGTLLATYQLPQLPSFADTATDFRGSAPARDGALWVPLGDMADQLNLVYALRIDRKGHSSEVAVPAVANRETAMSFASTASGDLWLAGQPAILYNVQF